MLLMLLLFLVALVVAVVAPFFAAWAAVELTHRRPGRSRFGAAVLAVVGSLWWVLVPDGAVMAVGALLSWSAVAAATAAAIVHAVNRRRATDLGWQQSRIDAWHARHPAMPPAWYGAPVQQPYQP
ncbi:hypothetical protein ABT095_29565 [Kitasatospora sp. NPDC002227]|uniref:hypothetical protein n=1 Tax=Kitasatospora sp. NPDC002227 TaxID=3154773 RepID=UPI00332D7D28